MNDVGGGRAISGRAFDQVGRGLGPCRLGAPGGGIHPGVVGFSDCTIGALFSQVQRIPTETEAIGDQADGHNRAQGSDRDHDPVAGGELADVGDLHDATG